MSDTIPKPATPTRKTGLSPKEQKLQALREKMAGAAGKNSSVGGAVASSKKPLAGTKKTSFQRKAT